MLVYLDLKDATVANFEAGLPILLLNNIEGGGWEMEVPINNNAPL